MSDLSRRSYIGVCSRGVCLTDLCHRSYIGICSVCVGDLMSRSYIGVCRGTDSVSGVARSNYNFCLLEIFRCFRPL